MASKRPLGVTIIAVLNFINGALGAYSFMQAIQAYRPSPPLVLALALWSICLFLVGSGLLQLKKWAYWAELGLAALLVVAEFVFFVRDNQALSYVVSPSIAIITYMLFGGVRHNFGSVAMQPSTAKAHVSLLPLHPSSIIGIWLIWLLIVTFLNDHRPNDNGRNDSSPAWSPDGKQIAFVSHRDGDPDIWIMNADGSNVRNLTNNTMGDYDPAWSPDGKSIVFSAAIADLYNKDGLYIINADGSNLRQVLDRSCTSPDWSPDGQLLVCSLNGILHVVRPDGTNLRSLNAPGDVPRWSPDGRFIAYNAITVPNTFNLWIVSADGTDKHKVSSMDAYIPDWSPDGQWFVFSARMRDGEHLVVMDRNGTSLRRLTNLYSVDRDPVWSPDGTTIAFTSSGDILVVNVDGSNVRNLINKNEVPPLTAILPSLSSTATSTHAN